MSLTYGFATSEWQTAQTWVRKRLREVARAASTITYSQLCDELARATGVRLDPHGTPLAGLLGQVNVLEQEDGKPLISCVVVHKSGDWKPGVGFWNMAFGRDPPRVSWGCFALAFGQGVLVRCVNC